MGVLFDQGGGFGAESKVGEEDTAVVRKEEAGKGEADPGAGASDDCGFT